MSCSRASSPPRNTRLSLVAHNALRPLRGEAESAEIEKQVELGKLSLADLDAIGERKDSGVLSLIFGGGSPQEVALAFLASDRHDAEVQKKQAVEELVGLLRSNFEADLPATAPLRELRDRLARHVLMTDLVASLGSAVPPALASARVASSPVARDACMSLAWTWRLRRDVRDSYVAAARKVEPLVIPHAGAIALSWEGEATDLPGSSQIADSQLGASDSASPREVASSTAGRAHAGPSPIDRRHLGGGGRPGLPGRATSLGSLGQAASRFDLARALASTSAIVISPSSRSQNR